MIVLNPRSIDNDSVYKLIDVGCHKGCSYYTSVVLRSNIEFTIHRPVMESISNQLQHLTERMIYESA